MAREASSLSLATCHAGFSRRGIDPVGETSNVYEPPLGSRPLVVSSPASRAGHIHAPSISESIEAVAIGRQPCGYETQGNTPRTSTSDAGGLGEVCASPYSHGKNSWGTHRAALGGTPTARELLVGGIWLPRRFVFAPSSTVPRVSGRFSSGASCPQGSMVREASTLSLATCHAGFSRALY